MGQLRPNMLLGVKCKHGLMLEKGAEQVSGKVLTARTTPLNRANWQFPNFLPQAYGNKATADFLFEMGVKMPQVLATAKDYKELTRNAVKYVAERDAAAFVHPMAGEPSNGEQE